MTKLKVTLKRATVSMCPECGREIPETAIPGAWWCADCQLTLGIVDLHWGYYEPGIAMVAAVVGEMKEFIEVARSIDKEGAAEITEGWVNRLEGNRG